MKRILSGFIDWINNVITEFNDNPKDFVIHALIVLVALGVWGLIMGIMEEYR